MLSVSIVFVADVLFAQLRIEGRLRWELSLIQLLYSIHVVVWIDSFAKKQIHIGMM